MNELTEDLAPSMPLTLVLAEPQGCGLNATLTTQGASDYGFFAPASTFRLLVVHHQHSTP